MRLEDKLMLNGEWAAIDELNKEKVRQANQRLIDEEAGGYQNTSDLTECTICASLTSHGADYCSECYFQETSENCSDCGNVLILGEQAAIDKQEMHYCFECEDIF